MTDNELIIAIKSTIDTFLPSFLTDKFQVSRSAQPTDQNISGDKDSDVKTQIFIHQVSHKVLQNAPENGGNDFYIHNRAAIVEISVLKYLDYQNIKDLTSDDIAEIISDFLFDATVIQFLRNKGVRLENRTAIRPIFIINDKERYENYSSFDIEVTYQTERKRLNKDKIKSVNLIINNF